MNYYYYPLTSKDFTFDNIFSSESISPPCVYKQRAFGTDFFNTILNFHHFEALVLYNEPPQFDVDKETVNHINFILKIPENILDPNEMVFISEKIIGYQKTIYLNRNNFQLLFFSEQDISVVTLKSEATLSTKSYKKFSNNFKVIEHSDCQPFNTSILETINLNKDWRSTLEFDRKFNFFKGLCYGFLCGSLRSLSTKETELKRSLQNLTNIFAEFKNKLSNESKRGNEKGFIKKLKLSKEEDSASNVIKVIEDSERLFLSILPGYSFSERDVENFVKQFLINLGFAEDHIMLFIEFKKMEDSLLGTTHISQFKSQLLKSDHKNPVLFFESLKEQVKSFTTAAASNADWDKVSRDKASDNFKIIMHDLSKIADSQSVKPNNIQMEDLRKLNYSIGTNEISFNAPIMDISAQNQEEFVSILNIILKNPKLRKGDAQKDDILKLVDLVGSILNQNKPGKESYLYKYLNGELTEYDADKVQSIAMRNFIAFVFNPDSIEKMENYLLVKKTPHSWIGYSFWCSFNGFCNISRNFVAPYFETRDPKISDPIDQFFNGYHNNETIHPPEKISTTIAQQKIRFKQPNENRTDKIKDFYNKFVKEKFKLSFEQFDEIVSLTDQERMISELKSRYRITKKDGLRLLESFGAIMRSPSLF